MNNISESFNSTILQATDKPILTMNKWIRNYCMNRIAANLKNVDNWPHDSGGSSEDRGEDGGCDGCWDG